MSKLNRYVFSHTTPEDLRLEYINLHADMINEPLDNYQISKRIKSIEQESEALHIADKRRKRKQFIKTLLHPPEILKV